MKCILVSPTSAKENFEKIQEIVVRERPREIDDYQVGKVSIKPQCLCFKDLGVCKVKCWFESNLFVILEKNYLPNDECFVICEIDNSKSKRGLNRVKCEFIRTITLWATNGIMKTIKTTLNTVEFQGCKKG